MHVLLIRHDGSVKDWLPCSKLEAFMTARSYDRTCGPHQLRVDSSDFP